MFRNYEKSVKVSKVDLVSIDFFRFLLVWFPLRISILGRTKMAA